MDPWTVVMISALTLLLGDLRLRERKCPAYLSAVTFPFGFLTLPIISGCRAYSLCHHWKHHLRKILRWIRRLFKQMTNKHKCKCSKGKTGCNPNSVRISWDSLNLSRIYSFIIKMICFYIKEFMIRNMLAVRQKKFKYIEDYMTVILFSTKSQPL